MSERLTTTIKHFKEGVATMGLSVARHSIESWQTELKGYDRAIFHTIAADLGHLHGELGKDEIDGAKVGKLMAKLGKETATTTSMPATRPATSRNSLICWSAQPVRLHEKALWADISSPSAERR